MAPPVVQEPPSRLRLTFITYHVSGEGDDDHGVFQGQDLGYGAGRAVDGHGVPCPD